METEVLENIGISRTEAKVYLALNELGTTTTGPLSKKSRVPTSNIYPILESLLSKGLISYKITANKRYYRAEDPKRLKDFLEEKKEKLKQEEGQVGKVITELMKLQKIQEEKQETFIYEGIKGIKSTLEFVLKVLKPSDTFYVLDASRISNEQLMGYFNDFHKRRIKKKIKYKIIYGYESKTFAEERKKYPLTKVKILPKNINIPSVFWVFKDYVVIAVFSDKPVALMIKNPKISQSFNIYFNLMWKLAKK